MLSAAKQTLERSSPAVASQKAPTRPVARLNARISAYLVDSVILFAFILVFFVIAGLQVLATTDWGQDDPSDASLAAFIAILSGGTLLSWTVFNMVLMRWRGQTAGKYVIGIRTVAEDGPTLTTQRALLRWFGLHPLLFHPLLLPVWGILSLLVVSLTLSQIVLVVTVALLLLCLVSPAASLVSIALDTERRALHDRLAGTFVVHLEQP